jgi:hypothetical protein
VRKEPRRAWHLPGRRRRERLTGQPAGVRYAEGLARAYDATLIPVLAWVPPGGDLADRRAPCGYLRAIWADDAGCRAWSAAAG